jgi:hypothetical protein
MVVSAPAIAYAKSNPDGGVKLTGFPLLNSITVPVPGGSASSTEGGTVNVPGPTGTLQTKEPVKPEAVEDEVPVISAKPEPPVQLTVNPCARVTVASVFALVHTSGVGKLRLAVKAPTSLPPLPVNVKTVPEGGRNPAGERAAP